MENDFLKSALCGEMKKELANTLERICENAKKWDNLPAIAYPGDAESQRDTDTGFAVSILVNPETRGNLVLCSHFGEAAYKFVDDLDGAHLFAMLENYLRDHPASGETIFRTIDRLLDTSVWIAEEGGMRPMRIPREGKRDRVIDVPRNHWMRVVNDDIWHADRKIGEEYKKYRNESWQSAGVPAILEVEFGADGAETLNVWISMRDADGGKNLELFGKSFPFPRDIGEFRDYMRNALQEAFPNLRIPPVEKEKPARRIDVKNHAKLPL